MCLRRAFLDLCLEDGAEGTAAVEVRGGATVDELRVAGYGRGMPNIRVVGPGEFRTWEHRHWLGRFAWSSWQPVGGPYIREEADPALDLVGQGLT